MLFVEMRLVSHRWVCFLWLDERFELGVVHHWSAGAIREVAEWELTPFPWLGHEVDLATALNTTTIALIRILVDLGSDPSTS